MPEARTSRPLSSVYAMLFPARPRPGGRPKAGGPHYLLRFASERTLSENVTAKGGNTELFGLRQ